MPLLFTRAICGELFNNILELLIGVEDPGNDSRELVLLSEDGDIKMLSSRLACGELLSNILELLRVEDDDSQELLSLLSGNESNDKR